MLKRHGEIMGDYRDNIKIKSDSDSDKLIKLSALCKNILDAQTMSDKEIAMSKVDEFLKSNK